MPLTVAVGGSCLCGAIQFSVHGTPVDAGYCHCTRCQRRTGTAASPNLLIEEAEIEFASGGDHVRSWRHPDGGMAKAFCGQCGGQLFSRDPADPRRIGLRLGALNAVLPSIPFSFRQYVDDAATWEPIPDDGLTRYSGSRFAAR